MSFEKINIFRMWLEKMYDLDLRIEMGTKDSVILLNNKKIFKITNDDIVYKNKKISSITQYNNNKEIFEKLYDREKRNFS